MKKCCFLVSILSILLLVACGQNDVAATTAEPEAVAKADKSASSETVLPEPGPATEETGSAEDAIPEAADYSTVDASTYIVNDVFDLPSYMNALGYKYAYTNKYGMVYFVLDSHEQHYSIGVYHGTISTDFQNGDTVYRFVIEDISPGKIKDDPAVIIVDNGDVEFDATQGWADDIALYLKYIVITSPKNIDVKSLPVKSARALDVYHTDIELDSDGVSIGKYAHALDMDLSWSKKYGE